jgi:hypothetical protein
MSLGRNSQKFTAMERWVNIAVPFAMFFAFFARFAVGLRWSRCVFV